MRTVQAIWREQDGVLSFEWIILLTLLAFGVVAGLTGARDAVIDELGDASEVLHSLDQSFVLPGDEELGIETITHEDTPFEVQRCDRASAFPGHQQ